MRSASKLRARQFLFEFLCGPIAFPITSHVFHHVGRTNHGPIQHELKIEMIKYD